MPDALVHLEPSSFRNQEAEDCTDCRRPTRYWLTPHISLCPDCAKIRAESKEIRQLFHELWTASVGQDGYDKKKWNRLRDLLVERRIEL